MTVLPALGFANNDTRDTLRFIFQVGLPALEECIKKKRHSRERVVAATAKPGSATLQQQGAEVLLNSCLCSCSQTFQQLPWRSWSIIPGSTRIHHCFHLIGLSSGQGWVETNWQSRKHSLCFCTTQRCLALSRPKLLLDLISHSVERATQQQATGSEPSPLLSQPLWQRSPLHRLQPPRLSHPLHFSLVFPRALQRRK